MKHLLLYFLVLLAFTGAQAQQVIPADKFGNNGISLTVEDNEVISPRALCVQQDGKLLISTSINDNFAYSPGVNIRRLKTNGTLDNTFGATGIVRLERHNFSQRYGGQLGLQHDGRIIVVSLAAETHFDSRPDTIWMEGYLPDGSVDNSFGIQGGVFFTDIDQDYMAASGLQIRDDDKILLITSANTSNYTSTLRRFLPNGQPVSSFGVNGVVSSTSVYDKNIYNLILLPGNKMVGASAYYANGASSSYLIMYNENGTIDSSVIPGGIVKVGNSFSSYSGRTTAYLQLQHDGKLLFSTTDNGIHVVYRFLSNGMLDTSFATAGKLIPVTGTGYYPTYSIDIQGDGKIIISVGSNQLARYTVKGSLDSSFGIDGVLTMPGILSNNIFLIQKNRLVVAGNAFNGLGAVEAAVYKPCFDCDAIAAANTSAISTYNTGTFKVFPNPATDIVHIQTDGKASVIVSNQDGKTILIKTVYNNGIISMAHLPAGLYYIKNTATGKTQKLLKQ